MFYGMFGKIRTKSPSLFYTKQINKQVELNFNFNTFSYCNKNYITEIEGYKSKQKVLNTWMVFAQKHPGSWHLLQNSIYLGSEIKSNYNIFD